MQKVASAGMTLSNTFMEALEQERGILLLEYAEKTTRPRLLEIWKGSNKITTIKFHCKAMGVEDMFRHVNLSDAVGEAIHVPSRTGEPDNFPDSETNNKAFVMIHGYYQGSDQAQANQQVQRGFYSEIFKRMHNAGSRAKYVAVTWHSATKLDYHKAAYNAFKTRALVKGRLAFLGANEVTVAAHSLGNVVTSNAVVHEGFSPENYFLINAAAPTGSYLDDNGSVPAAMKTAMTEKNWKTYDSKFHSPNWHARFPATDNRNKLKWKGRFKNLKNKTKPYNFYSSGEDVVANPVDDDANIFRTIWQGFVQGQGIGRYGWVSQEFIKGGTSIAGVAFQRNHGGWRLIDLSGSSPTYRFMGQADPTLPVGHKNRYLPVAANTALGNGVITDEHLAQFGYFGRFEPAYTALYAPINDVNKVRHEIPGKAAFDWTNPHTQAEGHALAGLKETQWVILASAMPTVSFSVAANSTEGMEANFNMMSLKNGWPADLPRLNKYKNDWQHSDFHLIGLTYVKPMFEEMIEKGKLKK